MITPSPSVNAVKAALLCCFLSLALPPAQAEEIEVEEQSTRSTAQSSTSATKDETNASPRERGRILVKRNPIASEYQIFGDIGTSPGADADGEGVDFRAFFPSSNPVFGMKDSLQLGYSLTYNDQSGIGKSGFRGSFAKSFGEESQWALAAQFRASASDRLIEHYESVWQAQPDGTALLDRPRLSFDEILTENNVATAQLGYRLNKRNTLYLKTYYQDYFDTFYRNRLELQFGNADLESGSETCVEDGTLTTARFSDAKTRRYFGDTDNFRTRQHYTLGGNFTGEEWTIDYALYAQKWNLDSEWYNWNFTERGLNLGYSVNDPYLPDFVEGDAVNLLNMKQARFSSLRIHNSHTRDRDKAARIDADRSFSFLDRDLWMQTGMLFRTKERNSWESRSVHLADPDNPFALADVAFPIESHPLMDGAYALQGGLDPDLGRERYSTQPVLFPEDTFRSRLESAPESYTAQETVTSAYLLGLQEIGNWSFEIGGRFEKTETETRGTVAIPESVNDPTEGALIEVVTNPKNGSNTVIKDLYSSNSYDNFIPSAEIAYSLNESNTIKAAWFQLLMRPQYITIVDYRRVSVPTRGISEGNPLLDPTGIDKFRVSWTTTNKSLGEFSAELYSINIKDFFYGSVSTEIIQENGVPTVYRVSRVENGESATINGFEMQWRKSADSFMFFDKASAAVAYTYSDSEAKVATRPEDTFSAPERSDHLLKATFSGTMGKLTSAVDITYQSEALDDLGERASQDVYRESYVNILLRNRYAISETLQVTVDIANVTDAPERSYEGFPVRVTRNQYSSWIASVGLLKSF